MADLYDRFRSLERVPTPDLWVDIEQRVVAAAPEPLRRVDMPPILFGPAGLPRSRARRVVLIVAVLLLILLALALAIGGGRRPPTSPLLFTTTLSETGQGGVYAVDVAGGAPRLVFEAHAQRMHVSPDGRYAFFEGLASTTAGLVLARTDGSNSRSLTGVGEYEVGRLWESIWAPDSHAVAWLSWRDGARTLMVADVDGGDPRPIAVPPSEDPHLVWSPDNVHIAYVDWGCETVSRHLTIVDTRAGGTRELGQALHLPSLPVWAHDGRRIAAAVVTGAVIGPSQPDPNTVTCVERSGPGTLVVGDIVTGATTTAMTDVDVFFNLAWSADDRAVMGIATSPSGGHDVLRVPAQGGEVEKLTHLEEGGGVVWSPDGSRLAWSQPDGGALETSSLWVLEVADGHRRRVAQDVGGSGPEHWPLWSPDSAWIAFHRGPYDPVVGGAGGSIWIVRADGTDERLLVDSSLGPDLAGVDW